MERGEEGRKGEARVSPGRKRAAWQVKSTEG